MIEVCGKQAGHEVEHRRKVRITLVDCLSEASFLERRTFREAQISPKDLKQLEVGLARDRSGETAEQLTEVLDFIQLAKAGALCFSETLTVNVLVLVALWSLVYCFVQPHKGIVTVMAPLSPLW
jgi:hypothetical protein